MLMCFYGLEINTIEYKERKKEMIKKVIYYEGEVRIVKIYFFGLMMFKCTHEYYLSEKATSREH